MKNNKFIIIYFQIFVIQAAGLVILSLLVNATTMYKVLKTLGLADISLAKKANMTNCVKRIMMTRDRCVSMLKMDKFLADANWDLVQEGISNDGSFAVHSLLTFTLTVTNK